MLRAVSYRFGGGGTATTWRAARRQPARSPVLRLWQFTQTTSHCSISFARSRTEAPSIASQDTYPFFGPTWSNSRTTGSDSPQSTHGWLARCFLDKPPGQPLPPALRGRRLPPVEVAALPEVAPEALPAPPLPAIRMPVEGTLRQDWPTSPASRVVASSCNWLGCGSSVRLRHRRCIHAHVAHPDARRAERDILIGTRSRAATLPEAEASAPPPARSPSASPLQLQTYVRLRQADGMAPGCRWGRMAGR